MAFANPSDSTEIFYGSSGDVRNEINSYLQVTTAGHYADENELPGSLIINSIRKATRLINVYLEPVYADQIPFTVTADVPKYLDEIASDMATYYVFRSLTARLGKIPDEKKQDYYDRYVDWKEGILALIAKGDIQLPELSSTTPVEGKSVRARNRHPIFDVDSELNQGPDPDLIDDIERDRGL